MSAKLNLRTIITVAALFGLLIVASWSLYKSDGQESEMSLVDVSFRLPIPVVDSAFAPYYLAVDKGFFEKHGLRVKIEPGTPELNPVKMLSQNTDQFAVLGGPELLLTAREKKAPIVGIAQIHKDSDFVVLLTLKESGLTKVEELEGKKVGFFYGHISTDIIRMLLAKTGVKVEEIDVGFDYGQLLSGQLDAQWAFRTTAGISLPAKGIELNVISPADSNINTQGHMVVTNEQMINQKPEIVQSFLNAVVEATEYSLNNAEEAILASQKRDPNFKKSVGVKQLSIYNAAINRNTKVGWISVEDMTSSKKELSNLGLVSEDLDVNSAISTKFLRNFYK